MLIEEPSPRNGSGSRPSFEPEISVKHPYEPPSASENPRKFFEVLSQRRSEIGGSVCWRQIADLLWYAASARREAEVGRAGLPVQLSATPSSGGLGSVFIVAIMADGSAPRLYRPLEHSLDELAVEPNCVRKINDEAVIAVIGNNTGCTLRFIVDWQKISGAYDNAESLALRESGYLGATIGLCAAALGLTASPLGFLGNDLVSSLGLPSADFKGVGGVQIGSVINQL